MSEVMVIEEAVETVWSVLHKIIDKVNWHTEEEQLLAHAAIDAEDPATKDLPKPAAPEVIPPVPQPSAEEANAAGIAQDNTGGTVLHAASSDTTITNPPEAETQAETTETIPEGTIGGPVFDESLVGTPMPDAVAQWLAANGVTIAAPPSEPGTPANVTTSP